MLATEQLRHEWGIADATVPSAYQTSTNRVVAKMATGSDDLAVKVDSDPHDSVVDGVVVHVHTHSAGC